MTKKNSTKRALVLSFLSLLLCFSMLIGTTFAWFTDEVKSANNIIVSGNLDVELEYAKVVDGTLTAWDKVQDKDNVFDKNALWEPGRVEVVYLKVTNLGTLSLKYQLGVNVYAETVGETENGEAVKLSDHLVFKVVEMPNGLTTYTDREAVQAAAGTEKGLKDYNGETTTLEPKNADATSNFEDYVALIVYMPETVGNEANYRGDKVPAITLGINLFATQVAAEEDSFGPSYDEDAWHNSMKVYDAADLQAAVSNGEDVVLMNNIELTESLVISPAPAKLSTKAADDGVIVIDLNGKTITGSMHKNDGAVIKNTGSLVLKNGTVSSLGKNGGSALANSGTAVLENVTLNGAPNADGSWPSYTVNNTGIMTATKVTFTSYHGAVASYNDGAIVTLNDCVIDMQGIPGFTSHGIYTYSNGSVVINGGTYVNHATDQSASGASVINGAVTINAGTFSGRIENYYGTPVIKGGTFSADPTKWLADGFKAVANTDGTYSATFPQESFNDLIDNANPGDTVNVPAGNFTLSSKNDLVLVGSGEDTVITFTDSIENVNISNATISGEPRLAVKSGQTAVFNNVNFEGTKAWGSVHGTAEFVGCSFEGLLHIDSSAETTTIKFEDCTFGEYSIIKLGGSADYILENCVVEKLASDATGAWGKEWLITYCDATFTGCTLGRVIRAGKTIDIRLNDCVDAEGKAVTADIVHRNATPNVWINGIAQVHTIEELKASLNNGVKEINIVGNITLTEGLAANNVTFIGAGENAGINFNGHNIGGSGSITYKNLNLTTVSLPYSPENGERYGWYGGIDYIGHSESNYINCNISSVFTTYSPVVNVTDCTFDYYVQDGEEFYNIFMYGPCKLTATRCTFVYGDRAIKAYSEAFNQYELNLIDCTFKADEGYKLNKALINVSNGNLILSVVNNTVDEALSTLDLYKTEGGATVTVK